MDRVQGITELDLLALSLQNGSIFTGTALVCDNLYGVTSHERSSEPLRLVLLGGSIT